MAKQKIQICKHKETDKVNSLKINLARSTSVYGEDLTPEILLYRSISPADNEQETPRSSLNH